MCLPIDIARVCICSSVQTTKIEFDLCGAIHHDGDTMRGGHYYADVKTDCGKFFRYNDSQDPQELPSHPQSNTEYQKTVYILIYRKQARVAPSSSSSSSSSFSASASASSSSSSSSSASLMAASLMFSSVFSG